MASGRMRLFFALSASVCSLHKARRYAITRGICFPAAKIIHSNHQSKTDRTENAPPHLTTRTTNYG